MPAPHRFRVPPEQAAATLADAGNAVSALLSLDAHMEHHLAWLSGAAVAIGMTQTDEEEPTKDARAVANVQMEQMRALRRDLADLAADAEAVLPGDTAHEEPVVREPFIPPLPPSAGPAELLLVQQSFAHGMGAFCRDATSSLGPLQERLRTFDDDKSDALAARAHAFLVGLNAPPPE
jgi:hypothetical protein